jgi:hypothetical protein
MRCSGSFGEQVEPVYRAADRLVSVRIKKEVARRIEQMDSGRTTKSEEPPAEDQSGRRRAARGRRQMTMRPTGWCRPRCPTERASDTFGPAHRPEHVSRLILR